MIIALLAGLITQALVGWRGWLIVAPVLLLLLINPAWAAGFMLIVLCAAAVAVFIMLLPWLFWFSVGIAMVVGLIIGLASLMGV